MRRSLQLLRFQLSKFRLGPEYIRTFNQQLLDATNAHLAEFYRQLIEPIESHLKGGHLIVAPHGFLHYLPFHALLSPQGYLGDRYSISYTPSASVYYLCATRAARPSGGSLVLGIPDPAAPQIESEVRAVASVLPDAEVFVGAEATDEAGESEKPRRRRRRSRRKKSDGTAVEVSAAAEEPSIASDDEDSPADVIKDWDIPSWNDLIASLYRPDR